MLSTSHGPYITKAEIQKLGLSVGSLESVASISEEDKRWYYAPAVGATAEMKGRCRGCLMEISPTRRYCSKECKAIYQNWSRDGGVTGMAQEQGRPVQVFVPAETVAVMDALVDMGHISRSGALQYIVLEGTRHIGPRVMLAYNGEVKASADTGSGDEGRNAEAVVPGL